MFITKCFPKMFKKRIWVVFLGLIVSGHTFFLLLNNITSELHRNEIEEEEDGVDASDSSVIEVLRSDYLIPPSPYNYNLSTDPSYKKRAVGYSWPFVHEILKKLFDQEYSKFFVEAGALDGEYLSNTLWLEQDRKWSGLLVEPNPRSYQDLILKRRKCWVINACLSTDVYPKSVVMVGTERRENDSLDTEAVRGGTHEIDSHKNTAGYSFYEKYLVLTNFTSKCFPLHSMLLALNQNVIDFLSLDIQGSEMQVFNTIPLDKINIRTVVIEDEVNRFDYDLVRSMNKKGFKLIETGGAPDYFFINVNETKLIEEYCKNNLCLQDKLDEGYEMIFRVT